MLTITESARNRLSRKLARQTAPKEVAIRLTRAGDGWHLRTDTARPDDTAFDHKGRKVLVMDDAVSDAVTDMTLFVRRTESGLRLRLRRNPV